MRVTLYPSSKRRILQALLYLTVCLSSVGASAEQEQTRPAIMARLAAQALLLDAGVAGNRIIAVGERGHIVVSDDDGVQWHQVPVPTQATLTAVYFVDTQHGWAVGHDATILHSSDAGNTWTLQNQAPQDQQPLLDIWFRNQNEGYAFGAYGLYLVTHDGGQSWIARTINSEEDFHFNSVTSTTDGQLYVAGEAGSLYHSSDPTQGWNKLKSPYKGSFFGILALEDNILIIFGLRGKIYRSTDQGNIWTEIQSHTEASLMGGTVLRDGRVFIVGLGGVILKSTDAGQSFALYTRPDRIGLSTILQSPRGDLLTFGEMGVEPHKDGAKR
ncbi:MAG: hypothetical protein GXP09_00195 [Gammaproteobacteria bacterium]|nr:hypothetical protein [Gammaproteobacteria bacterium]